MSCYSYMTYYYRRVEFYPMLMTYGVKMNAGLSYRITCGPLFVSGVKAAGTVCIYAEFIYIYCMYILYRTSGSSQSDVESVSVARTKSIDQLN